jgi:hypothetical protein
MVVEEVLPELQTNLDGLIILFQIIGGILGVYVIFWTINVFINARRVKALKMILKNVEEINKKIKK